MEGYAVKRRGRLSFVICFFMLSWREVENVSSVVNQQDHAVLVDKWQSTISSSFVSQQEQEQDGTGGPPNSPSYQNLNRNIFLNDSPPDTLKASLTLEEVKIKELKA
ncbi:hypothetical protein OUZ56_010569 [Daphnia magna]|uniref:Uncharacterized protein n=1 Tax=Daphnia magna TaxID=35525 RepID=A0ABR0AIX9_9CRUS|nr:hypothetical protein OUZ56_010569 [Daphnia magna]